MTNEQPAADHIVTRNKKEPPALGPGVLKAGDLVIWTSDEEGGPSDVCVLLSIAGREAVVQAIEGRNLSGADDDVEVLAGVTLPERLTRLIASRDIPAALKELAELRRENERFRCAASIEKGYVESIHSLSKENDSLTARSNSLESALAVEYSARKTAEQAVGRLEVERETLRELVRETKQEKSARASELDRLERQLRRREGFTGGELSLEEHHLREELRDFCKRAAAALNPTEETE